VATADTSLFVAKMERSFYHGKPAAPRRRDHCFPAVPSAGATVMRL